MNILDIFLIAIILIAAINGLVRGFVRTLFSVFSTIIVIVLTIIISPAVSEAIMEKTEFDENISEQVIYLTGIENIQDDIASKLDFTDLLDQVPLPENMINSIKSSVDMDFSDDVKSKDFPKYLGDKVASIAITYLTFIVIFLVLSMILNIILIQLDMFTKLPVIKQMNRLGGLALGTFMGVMLVWIVCLVLTFWLSVKSTEQISELIDASVFFKLFYLNNPIRTFVIGIIS